ncbi:MAG TPA: hypothetical protein VKN76_12195 [Kiloniellaceae bacterium]|nr:hypothetical protein [Kiloniellaceae bacterium]
MAIPSFADRVKQSSDTTGTGTLELVAPSAGFRSFVQGVGDGGRCYYVVTDGTEFEVGIGTVTAGATDSLSRDTVLNNSDETTLPIDWGTGTRDVFLTLPAAQIVSLERLRPYTDGNLLINSDFRVAQRGDVTFNSTGYTFDRWRFFPGGGSNMVDLTRTAFSLGQTAVSGEPSYYITLDRTNTDSSGDALLTQKIESVRTLAGQTCTVSYWARSSAPVTQGNFRVRTIQDFGSGGTPTSSNTNHFADPALSTAWQRFTATMTLPSISGATLGTDGNDNLTLRFALLIAAGSVAIDIANVKLEPGDIAGDYRPRPIAEELARCQRYYCKTFGQETAPAENAGRNGVLSTIAGFGGDAGPPAPTPGRFAFDWRFPQTMRVAPSITTYNPSAANSDAENVTDGTSTPVTADSISDAACHIRATSVSATDQGDLMEIHAVADAEL